MNIFDQLDISPEQDEIRDLRDSLFNYPVGSTVVYNTKSKSLIFNYPDTEPEYVHGPGSLPVGVVLEQLDDGSYIILYKGCLNKETLDLTGMIYNIDFRNDSARSQYLASVIAAQFQKYAKQFNKKLCEMGLKSDDFTVLLPSNRHFDIVTYNTAVICESMSVLLGEEKGEKFYDRLITGRFYCNIGGHIAVWKVPVSTRNEIKFYDSPSIFGGYFLPIIRVHRFG